MNSFDNDTLTLIDRYINNEMSAAEKNKFSQRLETDQQLKAEVELTSKLAMGIQQNAKLRARLKEIDENTAKENQGNGRRIFIKIAAAACVLLVGLVTFFAWPSNMSHDEIYAANFTPIEVQYDKGQDVSTAFKAYENGDYAAALPALEKSDNVRHLRYVAVCYMALGKHQEAIPFLDRSIAKDFENKPQALFYKALCLIKLDRIEAAKATLKIIDKEAAASGKLKKDARSILQKL